MLTSAAEGTTSVPADVRLANLGRVVRELRSAGALSRAEVACRSGVSVATGHRLISDLAESGLVQEQGVTGGPACYGPGVVAAATLHAAASCVLGPAIAAISLGLVGPLAIGERFGRNARYASLGNGVAAAVMGTAGYLLSSRSVFLVTFLLAKR